MKKGIVMEIDESCLTLLTPDGQFFKAKKKEHPYIIGEEILFSPITQENAVTRFLGIKPLSIAAAAILVIFGLLLPGYESNKAYAYMSIDVNPSIEIGINKKMQVVSLKTFNSDGKKIVSQIGNWKKKSVTEFTQNIIKEMKKEGYLNKHHSMVISTVETKTPEKKTEEQLKENVGQIKEIAKENNLQVTVIEGTEKEMEKAHQLGITTGKYKEKKFQPVQKQSPPLPPQSQMKGNKGAEEQNKNSYLPVNPEDKQNVNRNTSGHGNIVNRNTSGHGNIVNPNTFGHGNIVNPNTFGHSNIVNPEKPVQGNKGYLNNRTPPGQFKKTEQTPKEQWKDNKRETRINKQPEKHGPSINKNQPKKPAYDNQNYHNEK